MSDSNSTSKNLSELLEDNGEARSYFNTLPEFVRETLMLTKGNITGIDELKSCAANICEQHVFHADC